MQPPAGPVWAAPEIADYGFLSDCHSAALVDRHGSIDWWCVPRFDSPSVLGRLLDPEAGYWTLQPVADFTSERCYIGNSLVLRTVFRTSDGEVAVTDGLALEPGARGHGVGLRSPHLLQRRVEGLSGAVQMRTELAPRMEYGRTQPHLRQVAGGVEARGGPARLTLIAPLDLNVEGGVITSAFSVQAGQVIDLDLQFRPSFSEQLPTETDSPSIQETLAGWESWSAEHTTYDGAFPEQVARSSLVLQGLTFGPSGAIVAAATTSLPETMGGELNFDYRYAWLRDLSLTIRSLFLAACPTEPERLLDWLSNSAGTVHDELIQIMYGVEGERDLTEHTLEHLSGYRDSTPVRVGNAAWQQQQLDVFGEVLDAAYLLRETVQTFTPEVQQMLVMLAGRAAKFWNTPDAGMWEARDAKRHYTSSKVMCWVALDRAIKLAPRLGEGIDMEAWAKARDDIHAAVLDQAWSDKAGAYCGAFGSDDLDASVLQLPLVGFLPATDTRMRATIEAIAAQLGEGGLVRRWPSDKSGFLISTFWLVECLALAGEGDRAMQWFTGALGHANDLGLLAEEADPTTGELLGNYPQAFSHVGLINAAWRLGQPEQAATDPTDARRSTT